MNKLKLFGLSSIAMQWLLLLIMLLVGASGIVNAAVKQKITEATYEIILNKSIIISLDKPASVVSVVNPDIANVVNEIIKFQPMQLYVQGKKLGTTEIVVWDNNKKINQIFNIEVTHDLQTLKEKFYELLPGEAINVRSAQKNIVLNGQVSSLTVMDDAIELAQGYLGSSTSLSKGSRGGVNKGGTNVNVSSGKKIKEKSKGDVPKVINLMSVGGAQQVMLEVKVAEIDRKLLKNLDIDFKAMDTGDLLSGVDSGVNGPNFNAGNIFLSAFTGTWLFNLTIEAALNSSLAKILAEPTLTTLSGQEATFISGGEFPIPVPQSSGIGSGSVITIEFKEFGIGLRFTPVVLDSGRINLNMNVSVSELADTPPLSLNSGDSSLFQAGSFEFLVPSLTLREASSTLELADGQTMSIAGLISEKLRENVDKFPGLGDLPGLGALFRSEGFLKQTTELVIFVTPHLAKPVLAKDVILPTDTFIEPDDIDFYILGRLESRNARTRYVGGGITSLGAKGGLEGDYGQQLTEGDVR